MDFEGELLDSVLDLTLWRRTALPHPSTHRPGQRLTLGLCLNAVEVVLPALLDITEDPQYVQSHGHHAEL